MCRKLINFHLSVLRKSVIISIFFSAISSGLNYLFQIILANMLSVEEFGIYNSINSFAANMIVIFTPLSVMACKFTASSEGQYGKNRKVYTKLIKFSCIIIVAMMVIGGMFPIIKNKLALDNIFTQQIFFLMIGISGLHGIAYSIVQGMQRFAAYGIIGNLLILIKIIFAVLNLKVGMGIPGIIYAMLSSYTIVLFIQYIFIVRLLNNEDEFFEIDNKEIFSLYGTTFVANIFCSFYMNGGEIMLMTMIYDAKEIGIYSSAAMLGKISLYIVSILSMVLFPTFASQNQKKYDSIKLLNKSVIVSIGIASVYIFLLMILGKTIIPLFFGIEYVSAVGLIPYIAAFVLPLSALSIIHYYFLGTGRMKLYTLIMGIITCLATVIIYLFVESIKYVPVVLGGGLSIIILSMIIVGAFNDRIGRIQYEK